MIQSAATADQISLYCEGMCHVFAVALHRAFGWDIHLVLDQDETWWEDPTDPDNRIPAVVHAYALDEDGNAWDIRGKRPLDEAREDLAGWVHIREYDSDTVFDEQGLSHWCGSSQDGEDGVEIDLPLAAYEDADVVEAGQVAMEVLSALEGFPPKLGHGCP